MSSTDRLGRSMLASDYGQKPDFIWAMQNEDYAVEFSLLDKISKDKKRVLIIASAGDNSLSLLCRDDISEVVGVDMVNSQLHICELKRTAAQKLSREDTISLLGMDRMPNETEDGELAKNRLKIYDGIREFLPTACRDYWDRQRTMVALSILYSSYYQQTMAMFQEFLKSKGYNAEDFVKPDRKKFLENPKFLDELEEAMLWGMKLATWMPPQFAELQAKRMPEYRAAFIRSFESDRVNPYSFLTSLNRYQMDDGTYVPEWLNHDMSKVDVSEKRWKLLQGNVMEWFSQHKETYDLVSISNIADFMSAQQWEGVVEAGKKLLNQGGYLLSRRAHGSWSQPEIMAKHLEVDPQLTEVLKKLERDKLYGDVVAGKKV